MTTHADYYDAVWDLARAAGATPEPAVDDKAISLADRPVGLFDASTSKDAGRGRRLRVFAGMVVGNPLARGVSIRVPTPSAPFLVAESLPTYAELYEMISTATGGKLAEVRDAFSDQPLATKQAGLKYDPELPSSLQDLGDEINEDVSEACAALDDPECWFAGVDEGIEPVDDEHVSRVIAALQRELDRELRRYKTAFGLRPAAPLVELPWRVQRAVAERRRLRYAQFGIGQKQWETNSWSLWDVPEDPDWLPRRTRRINGLA